MKNFIKKYKGLTMFQKIAFLGSIASILSIITIVMPAESLGDSQTTYGNNSPNIKTQNGNINIQYDAEKTKNYSYLKNPKYGIVYLYKAPSLKNPKLICRAEAGSKAKFLNEKEDDPFSWVQVTILTGTCQGKSGWTGKANYHLSSIN
jgi:hypothetical protein